MEAIAVGVGYGWLPLESVEKALESGLLRRLELSARTVRQTALYMVMDNESERFDKTVSTLAKSILTECGLLP
jgi:DNA-binding transcriptional LysR family regulator